MADCGSPAYLWLVCAAEFALITAHLQRAQGINYYAGLYAIQALLA